MGAARARRLQLARSAALPHRLPRRDQSGVKGVNIAGIDNSDRVRQVAQSTIDELFSLMKPPSED